jgi:threonine synthase
MIADVSRLRCTACGHAVAVGQTEGRCPTCSGILDVEYDYGAIEAAGFEAMALQANRDLSVWRYAPLLPLADPALAPPMMLHRTPLVAAPRLAGHLGVGSVLLKDERTLPSGSLKDRSSWLGVARARELGFTDIVCASTGNAASSLAAMAASVGLSAHILVPASAPAAKLRQVTACGAEVMVMDGTYDDVFYFVNEVADEFGWYNRNCAYNPYLIEGKKTAGLELAEQIAQREIDWLAVAVGDGCTVAGIWKGLEELRRFGVVDKLPRLLAVQAAGADPLVEAFHDDGRLPPAHGADTVASAIAVGRPRNAVKALAAVRRSGGTFLAVSDEQIISAARVLPRESGFFAELGACAALAGVIRACGEGLITAPHDRVAVMLTGHGLKDDHAAEDSTRVARLPLTMSAVREHVERTHRQRLVTRSTALTSGARLV